MKVDDDTFINLPLLYQQLITHGYYGTRKHLLMGHCFCGNPQRRVVSVYHDSLISQKHICNNFYMTTNVKTMIKYSYIISFRYVLEQSLLISGKCQCTCLMGRSTHPLLVDLDTYWVEARLSVSIKKPYTFHIST